LLNSFKKKVQISDRVYEVDDVPLPDSDSSSEGGILASPKAKETKKTEEDAPPPSVPFLNDSKGEMDLFKFMFMIKKMLDYCDNMCKCVDPINDKLCGFCWYLSHRENWRNHVKGECYEDNTIHFLEEFVKKINIKE